MAEIWKKIPNYTMKCRLYPNQAQAQAIDDAIYAVQCYHNCAIWDMYNNHVNLTERVYEPKPPKHRKGESAEKYAARLKKWEEFEHTPPEKLDSETEKDFQERYFAWEQKQRTKPGDLIHYPNFATMFKADYKNKLAERYPAINKVPASAILTNVGLPADMKRSHEARGNLPIEWQKPEYYSKAHPRRSYTLNEAYSKIIPQKNHNIFFYNLALIGKVKVRGWNQKIRFDETGTVDFLAYAMAHKKEKMKITVSKDNCGDYFICFGLKNVVYKKFSVAEGAVGVDVGVKDLAILSDGTKFQNKEYKRNAHPHHKALDRRVSRRQGWRNIKFRKLAKQVQGLEPSKRYKATQLKLAKLDRKTARQRKGYNDFVSHKIATQNAFIGVESLNISGMMKNRHLSYSISDVGLFQLLTMLKYKASWMEHEVREIGRFEPSSQLCSVCGFQNEKVKNLSVRSWKCPQCGAFHDRDINAAKNILKIAQKG